MIPQILLPIAGTFLCYALYHVLQVAYSELTSPLRSMAGPRNSSFLKGNFQDMLDDAKATDKWRSQFGPIFRYKSLFSVSQLYTGDIKAINHIVSHNAVYQKPPFGLENTKRTLGNGLLSVEMEEHRRQRRILNQAFGVAQIRLLTETFVEKAVQLRDVWLRQVAKDGGMSRLDVLVWLRRMTLDVIGEAGFNYDFDAMQTKGKPNELNEVFTELFHSPHSQRQAGYRLAQAMVPILRLVPVPGTRLFKKVRAKMFSIGNEIVSKSKAAIDTKDLGSKRDLLSILLKANLSPDIPERQRLSDAEVISQIPTFFIAGHETTSTAVSWALHALSLNAASQKKLRDELLTLSTENPSMDELNALPYLESVVRETMRVHSPVVFTLRMAMQDDVLPLSKPYVDKHGFAHESLMIPKGQMVHIPILAINTDTEIWGGDAAEFRPERWEDIPEAVSAIPSVWANLLTFFAGPHNCIGFRFSLVEIKAILFILLRAFEFEQAEPKGGIAPSATLLQRPTVVAEPEKGSSLPLLVRAYAHE